MHVLLEVARDDNLDNLILPWGDPPTGSRREINKPDNRYGASNKGSVPAVPGLQVLVEKS